MTQDVAIEDWDALFDAVLERLRCSVEACKAVAPMERRADWSRVRSSVLECVQALDQLHQAASHEFDRHPQDGEGFLQIRLAPSPGPFRSPARG